MFEISKTISVTWILSLAFSAIIQGRGLHLQVPIQSASTLNIQSPNTMQTRDCSGFKNYTALGDSIAAGLGVGTRLELCKENDPNVPTYRNSCTTEPCKKWTGSYANTFSQKYHVQDFRWLGCVGATTGDVVKNELNPAEFGKPSLVTIQAGADNGELFVNTAIACSVPGRDCDGAVRNAHDEIDKIRSQTLDLIGRVKKLAQDNALIVIMGYYQLWEPNHDTLFCKAIDWLSSGNIEKMNEIARSLDDALRISGEPNVLFVDVDSSFAGHRLCSGQDGEYIFAPYENPGDWMKDTSIMHPNQNGQAAILRQLEATLGCV